MATMYRSDQEDPTDPAASLKRRIMGQMSGTTDPGAGGGVLPSAPFQSPGQGGAPVRQPPWQPIGNYQPPTAEPLPMGTEESAPPLIQPGLIGPHPGPETIPPTQVGDGVAPPGIIGPHPGPETLPPNETATPPPRIIGPHPGPETLPPSIDQNPISTGASQGLLLRSPDGRHTRLVPPGQALYYMLRGAKAVR